MGVCKKCRVALTLLAKMLGSVLKMYVRSVLSLNWTAEGNAKYRTACRRCLFLAVGHRHSSRVHSCFPCTYFNNTNVNVASECHFCSTIFLLYYWHQWFLFLPASPFPSSFTLSLSLFLYYL